MKTDRDQALEDLEYEIARNELEYADNFRVAQMGDREAEAEYKRIQRRGCCGYFDTYTTINGKKWMIGCNYGH